LAEAESGLVITSAGILGDSDAYPLVIVSARRYKVTKPKRIQFSRDKLVSNQNGSKKKIGDRGKN
jgi:hypothetical protein